MNPGLSRLRSRFQPLSHRMRHRLRCRPTFVLALVLLATCAPTAATASAEPAASGASRPPALRPDYSDTVIPPNIAPLNFVIDEPGTAFRVRIRGSQGPPIELHGRSEKVIIPPGSWHSLLAANAGGAIYTEVSAETPPGNWVAFATLTNQVATERIDPTLVYRLLRPLYSFYSELGIYQRDLESDRQRPVLENRDFGSGCLNCHTPLNRRPDQFALHIRGQKGTQPMLLVQSNQVTRVDHTAGYLAWHPNGRLLVSSANKLSLFFHTTGETRDVFDADSNLNAYWLDSNTVTTPPPIALPDRQETWPAWAPDGRQLYYCSAPKLRRERFRQVRYDLMRVSFDPDRNQWGDPECLVSATETGLSAAQPRVSPDGRWLLFCLAKYGNFPIYQPSSDLYVMDLATRQQRRLEINSDQADTWHSWSGNSRWVVFSSKRGNGLLARPHFSYVDPQGHFHKPFVLPQKDPTFYDACIQTFNLPEFVSGPIQVSPNALADAVIQPRHLLKPTRASSQEHQEEHPDTPAGSPTPRTGE